MFLSFCLLDAFSPAMSQSYNHSTSSSRHSLKINTNLPSNLQHQQLTRSSLAKSQKSQSSDTFSIYFAYLPIFSQFYSPVSTSVIMNPDSPRVSNHGFQESKDYNIPNNQISNNSFQSFSSPRSDLQESVLFTGQPPYPPQPAVLADYEKQYNQAQFYGPPESFGYRYVDPYTNQATYRQPTSRFSSWSLESDDNDPNDIQNGYSYPKRTKKQYKSSRLSLTKHAQQSSSSSADPISHTIVNDSSLLCEPPKIRSRFGQWAHELKDSFRIVDNHAQIDFIPTEIRDDSDDELTATYANPDAVQHKHNPSSSKNGSSEPPDDDRQNLYLIKKAAIRTAHAPLSRSLAPRHIQMIAFGGAVGTGLFIGTGSTMAVSGPGFLLLGFAITGLMLILTISALGELAVCFPVSGAFTTYNARFVNLAFGTVIGYGYACQWGVSVGLELVAAAMTMGYWSDANPAIWVAVFWVLLCIINLFGVRIFGEIEFCFSIVKLVAITVFIIVGIVIICGGAPNHGYIGAKYWHNPGSFFNGAKGLFTVFVNASFSYAGTELAGLTAAEAQNPRKAIPSAVKRVCWRIVLFYFVSLTIVGCLVPYTDPRLISGSTSADVQASPFVIALETAGLKGLPSVFNAAVLIAVMSVANSSVYATTRTLAALAAQGQAPKQLGYIDRNGRPIVSLILTLLLGLIGFLACSPKASDVFAWLLSISGLSCVFTWASICLCHIRFRCALKAQNRSTSELVFKAPLGIYGSMVGLTLNIFVIVIVFWTSLYPVDSSGKDSGEPNVYNFFSVYLCIPVTIIGYIVYAFFRSFKVVKLKDIDLDTGRRELDMELLRLEIEEENQRIRDKGWIYYMYRVWC